MAHEAYGFALMMHGQLEPAVTSLTRAGVFDPRDQSRSVLATTLILQEQWDAAQSVVREFDGSPVPTWKWLGGLTQHSLALHRGDSAEALRARRTGRCGRIQDPGSVVRPPGAGYAASCCSRRRRQYASALAEAGKAIEEARDTPAEANHQLLRIEILCRMQSLEAARAAAAQLAASPPPAPTPTHDRRVLQAQAMIAIAERRPADAVAALERARAMLPPRGPVPGGLSHHTPNLVCAGRSLYADSPPGGRQDAARAYEHLIASQYSGGRGPSGRPQLLPALGQLHKAAGQPCRRAGRLSALRPILEERRSRSRVDRQGDAEGHFAPDVDDRNAMKILIPILTIIYAAIAAVFGVGSVCLLVLASMELWSAVVPAEGVTLAARAATAIESIGLITVALMSLEMAQTVVEEEVVRRVHVSAPTRVRRYLSRFLVVVVVALSIESLVGVVRRCTAIRKSCRTRRPWPSQRRPCWRRGASSSV